MICFLKHSKEYSDISSLKKSWKSILQHRSLDYLPYCEEAHIHWIQLAPQLSRWSLGKKVVCSEIHFFWCNDGASSGRASPNEQQMSTWIVLTFSIIQTIQYIFSFSTLEREHLWNVETTNEPRPTFSVVSWLIILSWHYFGSLILLTYIYIKDRIMYSKNTVHSGSGRPLWGDPTCYARA